MKIYKELREECYCANMEIPKQNLAIYTFGNVSAFDSGSGVFAIKPSGLPYGQLSPEKIVLVDLDGRRVEGELNPSSDTMTHAVLYRHFTGINGICHTHSAFATAWAQACRNIPVYGTTHADHLVCNVPVTEIMGDEMILGNYEEQTGGQIIDALNSLDLSPKEMPMILVACHGPFAWGDSAAKAVYNAAVLEETAKMAAMTEQINPDVKTMKETLIRKHYLRKHGADAYYGQK